jgi:tRNA nucleotidyltransferase/poly(A) polymerase
MPKIFEVGGCVRDELLNVHTNDIDFTFVLDDLTGTVEEGWNSMVSHLETEGFKIFLKTEDCFTIRAMFPKGHQHEGLVADFVMARKEVGVVEGTRRPILELGTLEDDIFRRDFTVNALAKALDNEVIDMCNGQRDLRDGVLRTPLDPIQTLLDDPLRLIRALRFSITKNFKIHDKLWDAMFTPGLLDKLESVVSMERIQGEITKMMKHDTVASLRLFNRIDQIEPRLLEIMFGGSMWLTPTMKNKK